MTPSSRTPAAWTTVASGRPAGIRASSPARAGRSAASQAVTSTPVPSPASPAARPATPGAAGPDRLASSTCPAPVTAARCPPASPPIIPVPPVISTVPASRGAARSGGMVSTILPACRAWLMNRNASGARRTSQQRTGSPASSPRPSSATMSASIRPSRSGPASPVEKARYRTPG